MKIQPIAETSPHGHRLADDIELFLDRLQQRRRALSRIASTAGSLLLLNACGGGGSSSSSTPTATAAATAATTTSTSACIVDPTETAGPFPADGTNVSSGSTSDILTSSGIVRSDIRSSFIASTTIAPGVPLTLTLKLVNFNASCSTLQGYAIYLWHCDRGGNYSLYSAPTESYLRGVQVTDSSGTVTFRTIFPGCYAGRYPHIHFEVFASLASATGGNNSIETSQLAMPADVCAALYPNATGYSQSVTNFAAISLASDNVFGDDTAAQIAAVTPTMTGSVAAGYVGTATIAIAR
jgi:protocatechuate 3,4-dioxygenase beta subunit